MDADAAILAAVVVDSDGKPLAVARSADLPQDQYLDDSLLAKFGLVITVFWATAEGPEQAIGRREYVLGAYRDQVILIAGMPEFGLVLALRLSRSANAEHVYSKLSNLLGLSHNSVSGL